MVLVERELVSIHDVQACYTSQLPPLGHRLHFPGVRFGGTRRSAVGCQRHSRPDGNPHPPWERGAVTPVAATLPSGGRFETSGRLGRDFRRGHKGTTCVTGWLPPLSEGEGVMPPHVPVKTKQGNDACVGQASPSSSGRGRVSLSRRVPLSVTPQPTHTHQPVTTRAAPAAGGSGVTPPRVPPQGERLAVSPLT